MHFTEDEIQRYSRHILLPELGGTGQAALRAARVLVVGAGGLGCPLLLYLAAAGVGTLGIADGDLVELSNLQRQIAHTTARLGTPKAVSAAAAATALNPLVRVVAHQLRVSAENVLGLIAEYDIICDGSDNFATRYLVADACHLAGKTLVSAAVLRFDGQLATFAPDFPCYRCLYPEAPPPDLAPSCAEAGVLGAVTGVLGTLQAVEVIKQIAGLGPTMSGRLLLWDALTMRSQIMTLKRDPLCALCGDSPRIHDLSEHGLADAGRQEEMRYGG
jgi:adenylyltransferase/sulfurtransferase